MVFGAICVGVCLYSMVKPNDFVNGFLSPKQMYYYILIASNFPLFNRFVCLPSNTKIRALDNITQFPILSNAFIIYSLFS